MTLDGREKLIEDAALPDSPVLTWSYDADAQWWEAKVPLDSPALPAGLLTLAVAGEGAPDPALVRHATEIVRDFLRLEGALSTLLEVEARRFAGALADEVRGLSLASVNLPWPDRPAEGVVHFDGGGGDRVFRCDYVEGALRDLAFDE